MNDELVERQAAYNLHFLPLPGRANDRETQMARLQDYMIADRDEDAAKRVRDYYGVGVPVGAVSEKAMQYFVGAAMARNLGISGAPEAYWLGREKPEALPEVEQQDDLYTEMGRDLITKTQDAWVKQQVKLQERRQTLGTVLQQIVQEGEANKKESAAWLGFLDAQGRGVWSDDEQVSLVKATEAFSMMRGLMDDPQSAGANVLTKGSTGQLIFDALYGDEMATGLFFSALQDRIADMKTAEEERNALVQFAHAFESATKNLTAGMMGGHFRDFVTDEQVDEFNANRARHEAFQAVLQGAAGADYEAAGGLSVMEDMRLQEIAHAARESGQLNADGSLRKMTDEERRSTQELNEFRGQLHNAVQGVYDIDGLAKLGKMMPGSLAYLVPGGMLASAMSMRTHDLASQLGEGSDWVSANARATVNAAIQAGVEKMAFGSIKATKMAPGLDALMSTGPMARVFGKLYGTTAGRIGMGVVAGGLEETFAEPAAGLLLSGIYNAFAPTGLELDSPWVAYKNEMAEMLKPDQILATSLYGLLLGGVNVPGHRAEAKHYKKVVEGLERIGIDHNVAANMARSDGSLQQIAAGVQQVDAALKKDAGSVFGYIAELYPQLQEISTFENLMRAYNLPKMLPGEGGNVRVQYKDEDGKVQELVMSQEAGRLFVQARIEQLGSKVQVGFADMVLGQVMTGKVAEKSDSWVVSVEDADMNADYFRRIAAAAGIRLSQGAKATDIAPEIHPYIPLGTLAQQGRAWESRMKVARGEAEEKLGRKLTDEEWAQREKQLVSRVNRVRVASQDGRVRTVLRVARGGYGAMEVLEDVTEDFLSLDMEENGRELGWYADNLLELERALGRQGAFLHELKEGESYDRMAIIEGVGKLVQSKVLADTTKKYKLSEKLNAFLDMIRHLVQRAVAMLKLGKAINKVLADKEASAKLDPEFVGMVDRLVEKDVEFLRELQLEEGLKAMQRVLEARQEAKADTRVKRRRKAKTPVLDEAERNHGKEVRAAARKKAEVQAKVDADVTAADAALEGEMDGSMSVHIPADRVCHNRKEARLLVGRKGAPIKLENKFLEIEAVFNAKSDGKFNDRESIGRTFKALADTGLSEEEIKSAHYTAFGNVAELFANAERMKFERAYKKQNERKGFLQIFSPFEVEGWKDSFMARIELELHQEKGHLPTAYLLNVSIEKQPLFLGRRGAGAELFDRTEADHIRADFPEVVKRESAEQDGKPGAADASMSVTDAQERGLFKDGVLEASNAVVTAPSFSIEAMHATPHRFRKFDTSKMGTGEGAQAFGWGLYFSGDKGSNRYYYGRFSSYRDSFVVDGKEMEGLEGYKKLYNELRGILLMYGRDELYMNEMNHLLGLMHEGYTAADIKKDSKSRMKKKRKAYKDAYYTALEEIEERGLKVVRVDMPAANYRVELNVDDSNLLMWDEKVPAELHDAVRELKSGQPVKGLVISMPNASEMTWPGYRIYSELINALGSAKAASEWLAERGYKGIKYLDGTSRRAGEGTYNYVIFSGDDVKITGVNETGDYNAPWEDYEDETASFSVVGEGAANWDAIKHQAFRGRDDGKLRVELDSSQAKLKKAPLHRMDVSLVREVDRRLTFFRDELEKKKRWETVSKLWSAGEYDLRTYDEMDFLRRVLRGAGIEFRNLPQMAELGVCAMVLDGDGAKRLLKVVDMPGVEGFNQLGEVLDFPELFEAYPELKKLPVRWMDDTFRYKGSYSTGGRFAEPCIFAKRQRTDGGKLSTLLHEAQHWIQHHEDFAFGSVPGGAKDYKVSAGEIEARNVQARRWLSAEERAALPFNETLTHPGSAEAYSVDELAVSMSVVGPSAANWDKIKHRAFKGRDDGKLRVELDASQAMFRSPSYRERVEEVKAFIEEQRELAVKDGRQRQHAELEARLDRLDEAMDSASEDEVSEILREYERIENERKDFRRKLYGEWRAVFPEIEMEEGDYLLLERAILGEKGASRTNNAVFMLASMRDNLGITPVERALHPKLEADRESIVAALKRLKESEVAQELKAVYDRTEAGERTGEMRARVEQLADDVRQEAVRLGVPERILRGKPWFRVHMELFERDAEDVADAALRTVLLEDVLDFPELYEAYPQLRDYRVYGDMLGSTAYRGMYDGWNAIVLNDMLGEQEVLGTLLHEVQHAIQKIEGFARGGNEDYANEEALLLASVYPEKYGWMLEKSPYELYRRLAGEVEARNVQKRVGYSAVEREMLPFNSTMDVPAYETLVSFSVFSPSEASGLRALQSAVRGKQDAVFRSDTLNADVMLPFGSAGVYKNPDNPKSKIVGAHGLLHIITARMAHGDSLEEATYTAVKAVLAAVNGRIVGDSSSENKKELTLDGYNTWVYLKWRAENKAWVVTGYKENDKHSSVDDRQRAMNLAESYALNTFGGLERVGAALEYSIARVAREYKQNIANPFLKLDFSSSMVDLSEEDIAHDIAAAGYGFRANREFAEQMMREIRASLVRMKKLGSKTRTDREDALAAMGGITHMVRALVQYLPRGYRFAVHPYMSRLEVLTELATTGNVEMLRENVSKGLQAWMDETSETWHEVLPQLSGNENMTREELTARVQEMMKEHAGQQLTEAVERIVERVAGQLRKHAKDTAVKRMRELLERVMPKKDPKSGKQKGGKMSADDYRDLEDVQAALDMNAEKLEAKMAALKAEMETPGLSEEKRDEKEALLMLYDQFGDPDSMSAEEAVAAYEALRQRIWMSRFEWENIQSEKRAARRAVVRRIVEGVGSVSENEYNAKKRRVKPTKRMKNLGDVLAGMPAAVGALRGYLPLREMADSLTRRANRAGELIKEWEAERWIALETLSKQTLGKSWRLSMDYMHKVLPTGVAFERPVYRTVDIKVPALRELLQMDAKARVAEMKRRREAGGKEAETALSERDIEAAAKELERMDEAGEVKGWVHTRYLKELRREENLQLSRGEALYAILMYEQPTYTERMEAQGYTPEVVAGLKKFIGDGMLEFGYGLRELFRIQGDKIAAIYEREFGVPFPREENYFAARWDVTEMKENPAEQLLAGMAGTPGAGNGWMKTRVNHELELDMTKDALQVFLQATTLTDTWMATQDIVADFKAWTRDKDFARALTALLGEESYTNLKDWIRILEQGGAQDCLNMGVTQDVINGLYGSGAVAILGLRVQTLIRQLPSVFNGMLGASDITAGEWFATLARMKHGDAPMTFKRMKDSVLMKNRRQGRAGNMASQAVRSGDTDSSVTEEFLLAAMLPMEWVDASCTAMSLVPVWNVYYDRAVRKGANHQEAEQAAWEQTTVVANLSSQPIGWLNKSKIAQSRNPIVKSMFYMLSENTAKFALCRALWKGGNKKAAVRAWLVYGAANAAISALLDCLQGDPDEWEKGEWWEYVLSALYGPAASLPGVGEALEALGTLVLNVTGHALDIESLQKAKARASVGRALIDVGGTWRAMQKLYEFMTDDKEHTLAEYTRAASTVSRTLAIGTGWMGNMVGYWSTALAVLTNPVDFVARVYRNMKQYYEEE